MKKMILFGMAALLILGTVGVFAQTEADFKTDGNGTITKYEGWDKDITIPDSIQTIGGNAFSYNQLISVTIGANVFIGSSFDRYDSYNLYSFNKSYDSGGKQAGTYVYRDTGQKSRGTSVMGWSKQTR